jgi:four helix bundle protein
MFGLMAQMRRAAVSVPSNIIEGKRRYSRKELVQFLFHARGSLLELQTQITVAGRLGYLSESDAINLEGRSAMVGRLLNGLVHRFKPSPLVGLARWSRRRILTPKTQDPRPNTRP